MITQKQKAQAFKALHEGEEAFFIPNPWHAGSARLMEGLGFKALATTSSGFAFTLGRFDGQVTLEEKLAHIRSLVSASSLPVSADLENCFADAPAEAAQTIRLAAEAGAVGGSIEDYSNDDGRPIYDFDLAVERVHAAVEMARSLDFHFTLTARAENLLHRVANIDETIRRLQAFEKAGADVLYAPGLRTLEQIQLVTGAVNVPVNVLGPMAPGITLAQLSAAGVKRVSIGGAMTNATIAKVIEASNGMLEQGIYDWGTNMPKSGEIARLLGG